MTVSATLWWSRMAPRMVGDGLPKAWTTTALAATTTGGCCCWLGVTFLGSDTSKKNTHTAVQPRPCFLSPSPSFLWHALAGPVTPTPRALCEASSSSRPASTTTALPTRRMTSIGHFSMISETAINPSIITFLISLGGPPLTAHEWAHLWTNRNLPQRHPRFHQIVHPQHSHLFQDTLPVVETSNKDPNTKSSLQDPQTMLQPYVTETTLPNLRADVRARLHQMQTQPWDYSQRLWHLWIASSNPCDSFRNDDHSNNDDDDPLGLTMTTTTSRDPKSRSTTKPSTVLFFQAHHVLGDGASMTAAFLDVLDEAQEIQNDILQGWNEFQTRVLGARRKWWQKLQTQLKLFLWFLWGTLKALMHQCYLYFTVWTDPDPWRPIRSMHPQQQQQQHNHPDEPSSSSPPVQRTLAWTPAAPLDQVKWMAQQYSSVWQTKVTVNDIWSACVSAAIAKQLEYHQDRMSALVLERTDSTTPTPKRRPPYHMKLAFPVHLRGGVVLPNESVGNRLGAFVIRVPYYFSNCSNHDHVAHDDDYQTSMERLRSVHAALSAIKTTPAAWLSHSLAQWVSHLTQWGGRWTQPWAALLFQSSHGGAIAVISNNKGLPQPVHLGKRPVTGMYAFVPLPPNIPMGIVIMSYANTMNLTLTAEPWAVPDGDQFLVWVLEEYETLLEMAVALNEEQTTTTK